MGGKKAKRERAFFFIFIFSSQKFVKENGKERAAGEKTVRVIVWFPGL